MFAVFLPFLLKCRLVKGFAQWAETFAGTEFDRNIPFFSGHQNKNNCFCTLN